MIEFPSDDEIVAYAEKHLHGNFTPIMRDLARMAALVQMKDGGFFDGHTALAGGMALRAYGGNRLTMRDADTSTNLDPKAGDLETLLTFEIPGKLKVAPESPGAWPKHDGLAVVKPIHYEPLFSLLPLTDKGREFDITINKRGLKLDPRPARLNHQYDWSLGIEDVVFPMMDIREMVAEKALGYAVTRVQKHYADLAIIAFLSTKIEGMGNALNTSKVLIRTLTEEKLEIGRAYAEKAGATVKAMYADVPHYGALQQAFNAPDAHLGLSNWDGAIQWITTSWMNPISFKNAKILVTEVICPLLFESAS
jgi:hypothetical protein